jgi:hypothetical protein
VCAPDFTVVAVIELDDRSHGRRVQRERDQRKDRFIQAAGVKVFRVNVATAAITNCAPRLAIRLRRDGVFNVRGISAQRGYAGGLGNSPAASMIV